MKRLLALCVIFMLLLAACGQASVGPIVSTALAAPTTLEETTSVEATTTEPVSPILGDTDFTVTGQQLPPPAQEFDAAFEAFYKEFTAAVHGKDMTFIDGILDDGVMSSFGGEPTKEFFYEHWEHRSERKDIYKKDLWDVLEEIIALGGVYYQAGEFRESNRGKCFAAPYLFTESVGDDLDVYEYLVVIAKDVPVFENASAGSRVIARLDYDVLEFHYSGEFWDKGPEDFVSVTLLAGDKGCIQKKHLRSAIDYRLCIEQKDGAWKLLWLIAGD